MKKAFSVPAPPETDKFEPRILELNGENFELEDDLVGIELLYLIGETNTMGGLHRLISRVIKNDDWDRFTKITAHYKTPDFYKVGGNIADLYAENPIIAAAGS